MVGYCLTLLDFESAQRLSVVLHFRLRPEERVFVAAAALMALTDDEYRKVIAHAEGRS